MGGRLLSARPLLQFSPVLTPLRTLVMSSTRVASFATAAAPSKAAGLDCAVWALCRRHLLWRLRFLPFELGENAPSPTSGVEGSGRLLVSNETQTEPGVVPVYGAGFPAGRRSRFEQNGAPAP